MLTDLVREEPLGKVNSEHYWLFNQVVKPTPFGSCLNASKAESMPNIDILKIKQYSFKIKWLRVLREKL
jgi:hypothetical protein